MSTYTTGWSVPLWAWPYLIAALAAEAVSNALKAYGLGTHLEQFTLSIAGQQVSLAGAVLVLAAIAVSGSQARAAWVALTPTSPARQRIVAGLAALLLLSVSVSAMVSHLLEAQRAKVADEGGERGRHDRAKSAYDKLKGEDDALQLPAPPRSAAEIQADVAGVKIDMRIWRASKQCEDITRDESKVACAPVLALYKERARAARRTELAPDLASAKAALDAAPRPEEASAAETGAAGVWGWLMGFAVVFVATFGSIIFARVDAATRDAPRAIDSIEPATPPSGGVRVVLQKRSFTKAEVLQSLLTQLAMGDGFGSQDEMCKRFRVPKSTLSEWLKQWRAEGLVPEGTKVGRRKALVAA